MSENIKDFKSRVWFCVLHEKALSSCGVTLPSQNPQETLEILSARWQNSGTERVFSGCYAVSADGLHHVHAVLSTKNPVRLKTLQDCFHGIHAESMRGTKEQASAYLRKEGKFEEKGEKVLAEIDIDEIQSNQGQRSDLAAYGELLEKGYTPKQIFLECGIESQKYRTIIENQYYLLRDRETPVKRELNVIWHTGLSGSGKSYTYVKLCETHGEENVYFITDYKNPWDDYNGEPIVVMDDFKSNVPLTELLTWLDCYKAKLRARYANKKALYKEVHITSVYPPEAAFRKYVEHGENRVETFEQLRRRIAYVMFHVKLADGVYITQDFHNSEEWIISTMQEKTIKQFRDNMEELGEGEELPF